jgi:hypothetical protein
MFASRWPIAARAVQRLAPARRAGAVYGCEEPLTVATMAQFRLEAARNCRTELERLRPGSAPRQPRRRPEIIGDLAVCAFRLFTFCRCRVLPVVLLAACGVSRSRGGR